MKKVTIYTDGSCSGNPGCGGYAAVLTCENKQVCVVGNCKRTTNNRMEIVACIEALKVIKTDAKITVFSDSSYVVDFINNWGYKAVKNGFVKNDGSKYNNIDLLKELWDLAGKTEATFVKVDGHSTNDDNNEVDKLAVWATNQAKNGKLFGSTYKTREVK